MKLTSEQRILVVTNYLKTRIFKKVQQLFEQHFRDRVLTTNMTIQKNVRKYKTEGSSLNLSKDHSGRRRTECTQEKINLLQEMLIEDQEYQPERMVCTIVRVHLTKSLNAI